MILVISVCKERLHYYEFVKPIVDILENKFPIKDTLSGHKNLRTGDPTGPEVLISHYEDLDVKDLEKCDKVIICGTSLGDNKFLEDIGKFSWLKDFEKPVLGICAGLQIFGEVFGGKAGKNVEIGFFREDFVEDFLGLKGDVEVYHLHGNYVDFPLEWRIYSGIKFAQAVKWKNFYGVLFHPEVRNKEMILRFAEL